MAGIAAQSMGCVLKLVVTNHAWILGNEKEMR
jgi:hypothetical protein